MAALATSRHRGVFWDSRRGSWAGQVRVDGQKYHVGFFEDEDEAAAAVAVFRPRVRASWESRMVESLSESKRAGLTFTAAWKLALRHNPPRAMDAGSVTGTLFDEGNDREEPLVDVFERYCDDAWHGRRPALRGFSMELLTAPDYTSAARRGHLRVAA